MSTQGILKINRRCFFRSVDEYISCSAKTFLRKRRYQVGPDVDIDEIGMLAKMRNIIFDGSCGLTEDETNAIMEKINKLIS